MLAPAATDAAIACASTETCVVEFRTYNDSVMEIGSVVLRAFRAGADGVLVLGCHIGDCHYISGNHRTAKRMPLLRNLLAHVGIHPDRLRLDWVSSAEAPKFAQVTAEFVETIRALGPIKEKLGL